MVKESKGFSISQVLGWLGAVAVVSCTAGWTIGTSIEANKREIITKNYDNLKQENETLKKELKAYSDSNHPKNIKVKVKVLTSLGHPDLIIYIDSVDNENNSVNKVTCGNVTKTPIPNPMRIGQSFIKNIGDQDYKVILISVESDGAIFKAIIQN